MTQPPTKLKRKRMYRTQYGPTIRQLYDLFLKPAVGKLLLHLEETGHDALRRFFHADTRSIHFALVLIPFEIPGKQWIDGHPKPRNSPKRYRSTPANRQVNPGDQVIVRIDTVNEEVDIEFEEAVFTMPLRAYKFVEPKLELMG